MEDEPPVMKSLPEQPLTEHHVKYMCKTNAVIGTMPFPNEDRICGFVIERKESFTALVFDHRTNTLRKLGEYDIAAFSMQDVLPRAVRDRAGWFAETGRLNEL